jgi:hypothetical protein
MRRANWSLPRPAVGFCLDFSAAATGEELGHDLDR